jgi:hypothetical protein
VGDRRKGTVTWELSLPATARTISFLSDDAAGHLQNYFKG